MTTKQIIDYPSSENFQRSNEPNVPLAWAIAYLQTIKNRIPPNEQESAMLGNWNNLQVFHIHTLTEEEVFKEQVARAKHLLSIGLQEGLGADKIKEIYQLLK